MAAARTIPLAAARTAPWMLAAALALAWLAFAPDTPDLAAQVYRAGLFEREGFTLVNLNWYGGHHTPAYSILFPPLGALLGVRVVGVLAAVASALLFARIASRHFGARAARPGALWFAAGTVADLLIGRLTFALGVCIALAAVYALQLGHRRVGLAGGAACTLASPVAGLFLALAGAAYWLSTRERVGLWLAAAAMTPAIALSLLFPEGGSQPFEAGALLAIVLCCAGLLWLLPARERVLRAGALIYLGSALLAFVVASPMGGNASRLGVAFAGPLLVCAVPVAGDALGRRRVLMAAIVPLAIWQWWAPLRETIKGAVDPSSQAAYYRPLLGFLASRADAAVRVEVPFTRLHWESVHVARAVPLARGWVTQLDARYNPQLHEDEASRLTPARYLAWLRREGVRYVALPDVALDPAGRAEARLIRRGMAFLRPVFEDRHWRIFEVRGTPGLADGAGRLTRITPQSFTLRSSRPGFTLVRVRYTPYWHVARGRACVLPGDDGWTLVFALSPGALTIDAELRPSSLVRRQGHCERSRASAKPDS